jgi:hypothetical protein
VNYKKVLGIIFLNLVFCNFVFADATIYNYSTNSTYNKDGRISGNIGVANSNNAIQKAKKVCKDIGFKPESLKFDNCAIDLLKTNDSFELARTQEYILAKRAKEENDIEMSYSYVSQSGENITKESKWDKFWGGVAYIISEHGEDILNLAIDLKYDTNYSSSSNTTNQISSNKGGLRCIAQRAGTVTHQNCKGADGTHIYCMYQQIGKSNVRRTCRDKSRY